MNPFLLTMPPVSGVRKASLGYISLSRICIIQLCLDNHQSTDISEYCAHWYQGKALYFKLESLWRPVPVCGGYGWQLADMPHMHSPHEIILTNPLGFCGSSS